jgi:hypothetical protein
MDTFRWSYVLTNSSKSIHVTFLSFWWWGLVAWLIVFEVSKRYKHLRRLASGEKWPKNDRSDLFWGWQTSSQNYLHGHFGTIGMGNWGIFQLSHFLICVCIHVKRLIFWFLATSGRPQITFCHRSPLQDGLRYCPIAQNESWRHVWGFVSKVHFDNSCASGSEDPVFAEASISMQAPQAKQAMCCSSTFRDLIPIPDGLNQIFIYQGFGGCE